MCTISNARERVFSVTSDPPQRQTPSAGIQLEGTPQVISNRFPAVTGRDSFRNGAETTAGVVNDDGPKATDEA